MAWHTWWLFVGTVFFISASPGPNMLHVMTRSIEHGLRPSILAMFGCFSAVVLLLASSAAGLTALLLAIPAAFAVLKLAGAAYLVYLGYKAWVAPVGEADADDADAARLARSGPSRWRLFRTAFSIGISNPKALLFAAAFLPLFLDPALPKAGQFAVMVATFAVLEFSWYFIYALGGRGLAAWLRPPARRRLFNRVTGAVFVGFGAAIVGTRV